MDININVKIDSPNIVNAVFPLAEALEQMKAEVQINTGLQTRPKRYKPQKKIFKVMKNQKHQL